VRRIAGQLETLARHREEPTVFTDPDEAAEGVRARVEGQGRASAASDRISVASASVRSTNAARSVGSSRERATICTPSATLSTT